MMVTVKESQVLESIREEAEESQSPRVAQERVYRFQWGLALLDKEAFYNDYR
jgi:hypothetical protein